MDGILTPPVALGAPPDPAVATGSGCHGGRDTMIEAARASGKSAALDRLAADYPQGPHDQPQSMCPAFGSLRVGLRMRRTATILSGSACCVYGLTFTAHFDSASPVATAALESSLKTFTARFRLDQRDPHLLPDMSVALDIEAPK